MLVDLGPGRARFDFMVVGGGNVVAVYDLGPWDQRKTVAKDAESVVEYLMKRGVLSSRRALVYRDSGGAWDQIVWYPERGFRWFAPIRAASLGDALRVIGGRRR